MVEPSEPAKAAIGKYVTVFDYPDSRPSIRHNGVELAYRTFDKVRQVGQGTIADNKQLGAVLTKIRDKQLRRETEQRSGPRRADGSNEQHTRSSRSMTFPTIRTRRSWREPPYKNSLRNEL
jgi:hypothetical protein